MTRLLFVLSLLVVLGTLAASAALYPRLPDQVPVHWNIHGDVDRFGSKVEAVVTMPLVMLAMWAVLSVLPWLSPKQFKLESFAGTYWFIVLVLSLTFAYTQGLILAAALSGKFDITRALLAGILVMFGVLGGAMTRVRRNFWVGVRTPWTIASERVWDDTHRLAARLFVVAAAAGLAVVLLPLPLPTVTLATIALIMLAALGPVLYSLVHYKRLERRGEV